MADVFVRIEHFLEHTGGTKCTVHGTSTSGHDLIGRLHLSIKIRGHREKAFEHLFGQKYDTVLYWVVHILVFKVIILERKSVQIPYEGTNFIPNNIAVLTEPEVLRVIVITSRFHFFH